MADEKDVFLNGEADSWFSRNKDALARNGEVSYGTKLLLEFLKGPVESFGMNNLRSIEN